MLLQQAKASGEGNLHSRMIGADTLQRSEQLTRHCVPGKHLSAGADPLAVRRGCTVQALLCAEPSKALMDHLLSMFVSVAEQTGGQGAQRIAIAGASYYVRCTTLPCNQISQAHAALPFDLGWLDACFGSRNVLFHVCRRVLEYLVNFRVRPCA